MVQLRSLKNLMGKFVECMNPTVIGHETESIPKDQKLTKKQKKRQKKKEKKAQKQKNETVQNSQEIASQEETLQAEKGICTEVNNNDEKVAGFSNLPARVRYDSTRTEQSERESGYGEYNYQDTIAHHPYYYEEPLRRFRSVPADIYRQTGPPEQGPSRRWNSVPANIDVRGMTGGSSDKTYAAGATSGPAHQGNVIVHVNQQDGKPNTSSMESVENNRAAEPKNSSKCSEEDDHKTWRNTLQYYWDGMESVLEKVSKFLILFVVLPTFGVLSIEKVGTKSPELIFFIFLTTITIALFHGGFKKTV